MDYRNGQNKQQAGVSGCGKPRYADKDSFGRNPSGGRRPADVRRKWAGGSTTAIRAPDRWKNRYSGGGSLTRKGGIQIPQLPVTRRMGLAFPFRSEQTIEWAPRRRAQRG